jgi:FolB domain-containing protein
MDRIIIEDLEVSYRVGVPDEERAQPQRLLVSLTMEHDFMLAASTDDISATIDYFAVSQRLLGFGTDRSWKLIEKLAVDITAMVIRDFGARSAEVTVRKFIIPEARYVAVHCRRER